MANLDYNILSGIKPIQLESPQNQLMQAYQLKGAQEASQMNALKMQDIQQERAATNALNAAYQAAYDPATGQLDANKLRQSMARGGFGAKIPSIEKSLAETRKEQLGQQKTGAEVANLHFAQMHDYLSRLDPTALDTVDAFKKATVKLFENPSTGDVLRLQGGDVTSAIKRIDDAVATGKFGEVFNRGVLTAQQLALTDPARIKAAAEQFSQQYSEYVDTMARMGKQPVSQAEFRQYISQRPATAAQQPPPVVAQPVARPGQGVALMSGQDVAAPAVATPSARVDGVITPPAPQDQVEIVQTSSGPLPVSTRGVIPGIDPTAAAYYSTNRPENTQIANAIIAGKKPEPLTELGKLQRERSALAIKLEKETDPAKKKQIKAEIRDYDKNIKLKTEEASGTGSIPVSPVTIVDPNDPTKTVVVDARTGKRIGEGLKTSPGADLTPKDRQTREAKYPQAKMAVTTFESKSNMLAKDLETLANHPGLNGISGLINGRTMAVTGPARQALSLYNSIVARGGFKELADMRASSPTGGALGNVSNQEGQYLRDAFAPIDRTQDTSDLANSLKTAAEAVRGSAGRVREAFDTTYEYRAGQSDRPAASGGLLNSGNRKSLGELFK